jgi:hypothetical protein
MPAASAVKQTLLTGYPVADTFLNQVNVIATKITQKSNTQNSVLTYFIKHIAIAFNQSVIPIGFFCFGVVAIGGFEIHDAKLQNIFQKIMLMQGTTKLFQKYNYCISRI